jgi:hypothetical protein
VAAVEPKDSRSSQKKAHKRGTSKNLEFHVGGNTPTSAAGHINYKKALRIGKVLSKDDKMKQHLSSIQQDGTGDYSLATEGEHIVNKEDASPKIRLR